MPKRKKQIQTLKDEGWEFHEAERKVFPQLKNMMETTDEIKFKGYIDVIFKKEDQYLIIDWKTSKKTDGASGYRQQLELYKRALSVEDNIPIDKITVGIGFIGLRKTINDGTIKQELDVKQPATSVFTTVKSYLEVFLKWRANTEEFFKDLTKIKTDDNIKRILIEQYNKETKEAQ